MSRLTRPVKVLPIRPRKIIPRSQRTILTPREKAVIPTSPRAISPRAKALIPRTQPVGGSVPTTLPSIAGGLGLGGIGTSISGFGSSIMNQGRALVPIAVKIVAAVLVFKIVLWLIRGRRR